MTLGPFTLDEIYLGDCREGLKQLPDKSVDFVFTDPPFGHNNNDGDLASMREAVFGGHTRSYNEVEEWRPIAQDGPEANDLFRFTIGHVNRLLRSGGCCCCYCCSGGGGPDPQFARWSMWLDEAVGFKQMVVWDKGPIGMGHHYRRSYETVLVGQKKGGPCRWYAESKDIENIIRPGDFGIKKIIPSADQHPTEKPVELAKFFISLHTKPGDLVLDPFAGSGTTLLAAHDLGRHYLGFEIEHRWVDLARKRLAAAKAQGRLF